MAEDLLTQAAEDMAPARATTSMFDPSQVSSYSYLANTRRVTDARREELDAGSRLVQGRWDRMARRRQWDEEDETNEARKRALEVQGEYLTSVSLLDPEKEDYLDVLDDLIRSNPDMVSDPAVKPLLAFQAGRHNAWRSKREGVQAKEEAETAAALKFWAPLKKEAARLGMPEDEFARYQIGGDSYGLHSRLGEMERAAEAEGGEDPLPRTEITGQAKVLLSDRGAFPLHEESYADPEESGAADFDERRLGSEGAALYLSEAAKAVSRQAYIDQAKHMALTEEQKEKRGRMWDLAKQMEGVLGLDRGGEPPPTEETPSGDPRSLDDRMREEGRVNPPPTEEPAPAPAPASEIPDDAPRKELGGKVYAAVDGQWVLDPKGKKKVPVAAELEDVGKPRVEAPEFAPEGAPGFSARRSLGRPSPGETPVADRGDVSTRRLSVRGDAVEAQPLEAAPREAVDVFGVIKAAQLGDSKLPANVFPVLESGPQEVSAKLDEITGVDSRSRAVALRVSDRVEATPSGVSEREVPVRSAFEFGSEEAPPKVPANEAVREFSAGKISSKDNKGKPYIVGDKKNGRIYLFDKSGDLVAEAAALYGKAIGDTIPPEGKRRGIPKEKLQKTPAGRFEEQVEVVKTDDPLYAPAWVDFTQPGKNWKIAIHKTWLGKPEQQRKKRLASETCEDNRISGGCVNVPEDFLTKSLLPAFKEGGVVYIMPEEEPS